MSTHAVAAVGDLTITSRELGAHGHQWLFFGASVYSIKYAKRVVNFVRPSAPPQTLASIG